MHNNKVPSVGTKGSGVKPTTPLTSNNNSNSASQQPKKSSSSSLLNAHVCVSSTPHLVIDTASTINLNEQQIQKLKLQKQLLRRSKSSKNSPVRSSGSRSKKKQFLSPYYGSDPRIQQRFPTTTTTTTTVTAPWTRPSTKLQSSNNKNQYHNSNNNKYLGESELDVCSDDTSFVDDDVEICFDHLPDELVMSIFRYVPVVDLARTARVSRRFAVLWFQCAHTVEVRGKLRRMKEDNFVQVVRKFVRLESLDLCNTGSSEDFQLTDKGLLQLAHKYIYSNADYLSVPKDDPLSGSYDFNFDYESHLDSLDDMTGSFTGDTIYEDSDLDTQNDFTLVDEDEFSSESGSYNSMSEISSHSELRITASQRRLAQLANQKRVHLQKFGVSNSYNLQYYTHISYVYPPPRSGDQRQNHSQKSGVEPHYGLHTLKSLNFLGCHHITENGIKYLTFFCQNLRDLNLKGCTKVNDNALIYLAQFEHLVSLDLTGCVHISDLGLRHLATSKSKNTLQFLDVTFCHKITDEGLQSISQLTALEVLNLQCCRFITNKGLSYILNACKGLKSLNLTGCDKATLSGIDAPDGLPKLERITMMGCKLTSDSCMNNLNMWTKNLKELVLAFSDHITDQGIKTIVEGSPNLTVLNLKRCDNITDLSLEYISEHLGNTLQQLNLTGCRQFTNRGLGFLTTLHHLEDLQLRKCYQIDNTGLDYVGLCIYLIRLDVSECNNITDTVLKKLCNTLCNPKRIQEEVANSSNSSCRHLKRSGLRELKVEKCPLLSKEVLDMLQMSYSHVSFTV